MYHTYLEWLHSERDPSFQKAWEDGRHAGLQLGEEGVDGRECRAANLIYVGAQRLSGEAENRIEACKNQELDMARRLAGAVEAAFFQAVTCLNPKMKSYSKLKRLHSDALAELNRVVKGQT